MGEAPSWPHGLMPSWPHGLMLSWPHGLMASWPHGLMALWSHTDTENRIHGKADEFQFCRRRMVSTIKEGSHININWLATNVGEIGDGEKTRKSSSALQCHHVTRSVPSVQPVISV